MDSFAPSPYQERIFDWVKNGFGHAVVDAKAGSGKTTTMIEALRLMDGQVLFCAFNKHIADELKLRLRTRGVENVTASTIHSFGLSALTKAMGRAAVDASKYRNLLRELATEEEMRNKTLVSAVLKVTDLVRQTLADEHDRDVIDAMCDIYDIETNGSFKDLVRLVPLLVRRGIAERGVIDFTDMIYLPVKLGLPVRDYDWVCVDEAQDLNACQRTLVLKAGRAGRILAVGDPRQAIYQWSGADSESIPKFLGELNATVLPLSICYRCPKTHIAEAQKLVPEIEAAPNAADGIFGTLKLADAITNMKRGDMVLCRVNAPLAKIALSLIRGGKKATIRGRDIGSGLTTLMEKHGHDAIDVKALISHLVAYRDVECAKLRAAEKDMKAENLHDRIETIIALSDGLSFTADLKSRIQSIFADETAGIVCSSVHRAKGLEADRVYIYRPELMPWPKARGKEQLDAENNVKYVALTRAKMELYFVEADERIA